MLSCLPGQLCQSWGRDSDVSTFETTGDANVQLSLLISEQARVKSHVVNMSMGIPINDFQERCSGWRFCFPSGLLEPPAVASGPEKLCLFLVHCVSMWYGLSWEVWYSQWSKNELFMQVSHPKGWDFRVGPLYGTFSPGSWRRGRTGIHLGGMWWSKAEGQEWFLGQLLRREGKMDRSGLGM